MHKLIYQLNKIREKNIFIDKLSCQVQERTIELASANKNLENLLHQILPVSVAMSLSRGEAVTPEHFDSVSICPSIILLQHLSTTSVSPYLRHWQTFGVFSWGGAGVVRDAPLENLSQSIVFKWDFGENWPKYTVELRLRNPGSATVTH